MYISTVIFAQSFTMPEVSANTLLIIVTVILSIMAESNPSLKANWLFIPFRVYNRGEYHRFLTSGFIHSGYLHLAFNMIVLYSFGDVVEGAIFNSLFGFNGIWVYVVFYILAMVVSDIPTLIKYRNNDLYRSLGASGAVSAVVFTSILFFPTLPLQFIFLPGLEIPGFILGILYLFYSFYMARNSNDYINHDAHLYGSLFGILFSIIVYPKVIQLFIQQISEWPGFF